MPLATWLPDVLRADGLRVIEMAGWETRQSRVGFAPLGVVCHHTATSKAASNTMVRNLLRDGRSDLKGPLSQLGLERDGTYVVVAAGRCNHNGYGTWGNDSIGIEAYNDGKGEPWPAVQLDAYVRGCAAICRHQAWNPYTCVKAHRETDPGRKIDPTGIDMNVFRRSVDGLLEDDMPTIQEIVDALRPVIAAEVNKIVDERFVAEGTVAQEVRNVKRLCVAAGIATFEGGDPDA